MSVEWIKEPERADGGDLSAVRSEKPLWYSALETMPSGLPWGWIIGGAVVAVIGVVAYRVWAPILRHNPSVRASQVRVGTVLRLVRIPIYGGASADRETVKEVTAVQTLEDGDLMLKFKGVLVKYAGGSKVPKHFRGTVKDGVLVSLWSHAGGKPVRYEVVGVEGS